MQFDTQVALHLKYRWDRNRNLFELNITDMDCAYYVLAVKLNIIIVPSSLSLNRFSVHFRASNHVII